MVMISETGKWLHQAGKTQLTRLSAIAVLTAVKAYRDRELIPFQLPRRLINCCQVRRSRVPWVLKLYQDGESVECPAPRDLMNAGLLFYVYLLSE
jgi:hypothetical protein